MPDDPNLFDDEDNLIPDWMRAMEPDEEETPPPTEQPPPPTPWDRLHGEQPAQPGGPPPIAPWQAAPPEEEAAAEPWDMLEEPAPVGDFDAFDWSVFGEHAAEREEETEAPAEPAPWQKPAPGTADTAEPLSPSDEEFWSGLGGTGAFSSEGPASGAGDDVDWLSTLEVKPERAAPPPPPEPTAPEPLLATVPQEPAGEPDDFDDMAAFFDDEPVSASQPPRGPVPPPPPEDFDDLAALFDDEEPVQPEPAPEPEPPPAKPGRTGALRWLQEFERSAPAEPEPTPPAAEEAPAEPGAIPDWLQGATVTDSEEAGSAEETGEEAAPWLRAQSEAAPPTEIDFEAWAEETPESASVSEVPDWFRALDEDEPAPRGAPAPQEPSADDWLSGPEQPGASGAQDWDSFEFDAEHPAEEGAPGSAEPGEIDWGRLDEAARSLQPGDDQVPDWLRSAGAPRDMRARPDDISVPEFDLGRDEVEEPADFVERFDPFAGDVPSTPASVEETAPDWLRDMAGAAGQTPEEPEGLFDELPDIAPPPGTGYVAAEDDLDWLGALDEGELAAAETGRTAPQPEWGAAETSAAEEFGADDVDIDALLGLDEEAAETPVVPPLPPMPPFSEAEGEEFLFEEADQAELEQREEAPFEISGVPEPFELDDADQVPDLAALLAGGELRRGEVPDLESLFGETEETSEAAFDFFPESETPAEQPSDWQAGTEAEPEPESRRRFPWRRRKPAEEPRPAPPVTPDDVAPAVAVPQPEWVEELRPSEVPVTLKAGGTEASVTQKQIAELPERMRALREESLRELGAQPATHPAVPLPGMDMLAPSAVGLTVEGLSVTKAQQARVDKLRAVLEAAAADEDELDTGRAAPGLAWPLGEAVPQAVVALPELPKRRRRARRLKADRVLLALALLIGVLVPFATDAAFFADDPPPLPADGRAVSARVADLDPGDHVLFAFEYGPMSAGVLDPLAQAVLRDVLAQRAIPLTISTNPAGAYHASAVLAALADDPALLAARSQEEAALEPGQDYVLLRYLPGDAVGVRALSGVLRGDRTLLPHPAFERDLYGEMTGLNVRSVAYDIPLIVVISDESGAVRMWAEQLQDANVAKVALVTSGVEPLTVPYVQAGEYAGYLAGVRDTYAYNMARNAETLTPYAMPDDLPVELPDPTEARWHSMALGAGVAAGVIALGMLVNLVRAIPRRRRR